MKIKNLISLILAVVFLTACSKEAPLWEYKIIRQTEEDGKTLQEQADNLANRAYGNYGADAMLPMPYTDPTSQLNQLGEQGWELVSVYTTTETVFPNFGDSEYHAGIKANTRTQTINFVLKRRVNGGSDNITN